MYVYVPLVLLVTSRWEPPCGSWELNPSILEEQWELLTTEPSLQRLVLFFQQAVHIRFHWLS